MIDRLEILVSRLRRLVSRTRWSSRLLGHPAPRAHADAPGLVLIQVDGLGEGILKQALHDGNMPFLKRLVEQERHEIRSVYTGLPSNTPGFHAELFYGVPSAVPSFRFRDPETGKVVLLNERETVVALESRLAAHGPGLLEGGSAWAGIYNGGAAESHLCVATPGLRRVPRLLRRLRLAGVLAAHTWSLLRVLGALMLLTGAALRNWMRGRIDRHDLAEEIRVIPFRVLVSAALREIVAAGAAIDAERGLPIIHLNFPGYDDNAHRRGPDSRVARWSLRGIDRSIQRVWLAAHRATTRDYQVWIYSDHGQEPVVSFERRTGETLPETVDRVYAWVRDIVGKEGTPPPAFAFLPTRGEARAQTLAAGLPDWMAGGEARRAGANDRPRPAATSEHAGGDAGDGALEVVYQGPLASVHLPAQHDRAFLAWFAEVLAAEGSVPWVLVRESETSALAFHTDGRFHRLPEDAAVLLGAEHPYLDLAARDLVKLVNHPGGGDLLLLGWDARGSLSFEEERGSHGGPGPAETSAFVVLPPESALACRKTTGVRPVDLRRLAFAMLDRAPEPSVDRGPRMEVLGTREHVLEEDAAEVHLRLMTYNVHGCRGMDGKYAPHRIARVVARERPDVVCLQELDQERTRSGGIDQVAVIARQLRADYRFHAAAEVDDGRFGNAVLSAFPIRFVAADALPAAERAKDMFNLEDRGVLWVELALNGATIQILNTHLSILQHERRIQVEALLGEQWLGHPDCRGPVILAGDFNASPDSWSVRRVESRLRNAVPPDRDDRDLRTWSGRMPLRRIDHVFVGEDVRVEDLHVPRNRLSRVASDHLPMVVDLICRVPVKIG
jgi:endonuclease/exonuclease/phosphatase family metal-dependent hydrolase